MNKTAIFFVSIATITAFGIGIYGYNKGWFYKSKNPSNNTETKETLSQEEANKIANDVFVFTKNYVDKNGALDKFSSTIRDNMLQPLFKGGFKYENGKAIKK